MTEEELIHRIANDPQAGDGLSGDMGSMYHVDCAGRNLVGVQVATKINRLIISLNNKVYTRTDWRDLVYDLNRHITKPEK